jgi:hypothetical protein
VREAVHRAAADAVRPCVGDPGYLRLPPVRGPRVGPEVRTFSCTAGGGRTPRGRWRCSARRWACCAGTGYCCRVARCWHGRSPRRAASRRSGCTPPSPVPPHARTRSCRAVGGHARGAGGVAVLGAGAAVPAADAGDGHGVRPRVGAGGRGQRFPARTAEAVTDAAEPDGGAGPVRARKERCPRCRDRRRRPGWSSARGRCWSRSCRRARNTAPAWTWTRWGWPGPGLLPRVPGHGPVAVLPGDVSGSCRGTAAGRRLTWVI